MRLCRLESGRRTDLLTPRPEKPNSTATLFIVVFGTIVGHLLGACFLVAQSSWCELTRFCLTVKHDPNVYRVILGSGHPPSPVPDASIVYWLGFLLTVGILTGWLFERLAKLDVLSGTRDAIDFGWLNPAVQAVKRGDSVVLAYVLTKTSYEGATVAYEGIVQRLALDDDQRITMVVLGSVDRFLVVIKDGRFTRMASDGQPIVQMQFTAAEIANIALEVARDLSQSAPVAD